MISLFPARSHAWASLGLRGYHFARSPVGNQDGLYDFSGPPRSSQFVCQTRRSRCCLTKTNSEPGPAHGVDAALAQGSHLAPEAVKAISHDDVAFFEREPEPAKEAALVLAVGADRVGQQGATAREKRPAIFKSGKPQPGFWPLGWGQTAWFSGVSGRATWVASMIFTSHPARGRSSFNTPRSWFQARWWLISCLSWTAPVWRPKRSGPNAPKKGVLSDIRSQNKPRRELPQKLPSTTRCLSTSVRLRRIELRLHPWEGRALPLRHNR